MTKIGFTGTRSGMTKNQVLSFKDLIKAKEFGEFHHGMCIGSDEQAHDIIKNGKRRIIGHPPTYKKYMAECDCDIIKTPNAYLARNKHIVDATEILIATPESKEVVHSGTWSTVRYARKKNKKIYIIHRSGRVSTE